MYQPNCLVLDLFNRLPLCGKIWVPYYYLQFKNGAMRSPQTSKQTITVQMFYPGRQRPDVPESSPSRVMEWWLVLLVNYAVIGNSEYNMRWN